MKKILTGAFLFLVSGTISAVFGENQLHWMLWFFPGVVFGITGALYSFLFISRSTGKIISTLLWIGASAFSYYSAVYSAIYVASYSKSPQVFSGPFFIGGIVGGFLMVASWFILIQRIRPIFIPLLVILSGMFGFLPTLLPSDFFIEPIRILFLLWQAGMGLALGFAMHYSESKTVSAQ